MYQYLVDWSLSGIMTSKRVIRESEFTNDAFLGHYPIQNDHILLASVEIIRPSRSRQYHGGLTSFLWKGIRKASFV